MSSKGVDAIEKQGQALSGKYAGITTDTFISAAYDIRSGIESLTEEGVASMTASAALVAKATKSEVGQMTSLFATSYGIFKKAMPNLDDAQFGEQFGASLAGSVKQFKTDGAKMQQAIQSLGSGAALKGMDMFETMTLLGMLQAKMQAGVAGISVKSYTAKAQKADDYFKENGIDISVTTDDGQLESVANVIRQVKQQYGDKYTTEVGDIIQDAFGSEEAVKVFEGLWEQVDKINDNIKTLKKVGAQGSAFTGKMAADMDNNTDARMQVLGQKWDVVLLKIGNALIPMLEKMMPSLEAFSTWVSDFIEGNEGLAGTLAAVVAGIGGFLALGGGLIIAIASLTGAAVNASAALAGLKLSANMRSAAGGLAGGGITDTVKKAGFGTTLAANAKGGWWKGLGKFGKFTTGLTAAIGAYQVQDVWRDETKTKGEALDKTTEVAGGLAGMWGGAAAGAAAGSIVPFIGTAIGGAVGGALGYWGGSELGDVVGDLWKIDNTGKQKSELVTNGATAQTQAPIQQITVPKIIIQASNNPVETAKAVQNVIINIQKKADVSFDEQGVY
jgi:TP901 family phage tail tape measure protein